MMDQWSMSGRIQAPHRSGELLDIWCNVDVEATSEADALTAGARKIAQDNGGNPDQARWVGTPPTPWNRSEAVREARYARFDWCI